MKFFNIDGTEYKVSIEKYRNIKTNASGPHKKAYELTKELFPCNQILHEVPIKVGRKTLFLDILIPQKNLVIEINGSQHRKFNKLFHKNQRHFLECQKLDRLKIEWCELNNLDLVVLDDDRESEWKILITERPFS